jgi:hypothetical protein
LEQGCIFQKETAVLGGLSDRKMAQNPIKK